MFDALLSPLSPHLCCGCGEIGSILCDNCKYDITNEPFSSCIQCGVLVSQGNCCGACRERYTDAWCVSERTGAIERLIDQYKFARVRAATLPLATLVAQTVGQLPPETVIVPIPTINRHIRQRGYDHMMLIARCLAKLRGWRVVSAVQRRTQTTQRGAAASERKTQAQRAFYVPVKCDPSLPYLVIDDVMTTGATVEAAVASLRAAGAERVYVAVIARQPLD